MIITRTPFRISFFGGGTDYPVYYKECGGCVLSTSINRYCYISLRYLPPFFNYRHRIVYSKNELVNEIEEIVHPSIRECLRYTGVSEGLEIHHDGDLPARTGLGSSSSFTVGLLLALHAFKGEMVGKMDLAEEAISVEQDMIKENVGSQDQTIAAFGGLNLIRFNSSHGNGEHIDVQPVHMDSEKLALFQGHLMLFFTGFVRNASDIAAEQIRLTSERKSELGQMHAMVEQAARILAECKDITDFGKLLHENWLIKRSLTGKISSPVIDDIYEKARNAGAIGGKILGAGGGGFILFFVKPEDHERVKRAVGLLHVPFSFEFRGSHVLLYEPTNRQ